MRKVFLQVIPLLLFSTTLLGQSNYIAQTKMTQDLEYLVKAIDYSHVNPYSFRSKKNIRHYIDSVKQALPDSLTSVAFWRIVNKTLVYYNDAHTRTFDRVYFKQFVANEGTLFPIEVAVKNKRLVITQLLKKVTALKVNQKIMRINGIHYRTIIQHLRRHASKELTFLDDQMISDNFSRYLWKAFGWSGSFKVEVETNLKTKQTSVVVIEGVSALERQQRRKLSVMVKSPQAFSSRQINDSIAYIKIKDFYTHGRKYYRQKAAKVFTQLNQKSSNRHLIIDFRGHDGGDARYAEDFARYLATRPFRAMSQTQWKVTKAFKRRFAKMYIPGILRWCRPLYVVNKHTRNIWRTKNGKIATVYHKTIQPLAARKRFRGKIYLLTDHFTFSAGSIFAAMFKDYKMGTIIGRPTGSLSSFFADPIMWHRLPNSRITFQVSASYQIRPNGDKSLQTVQPDVFVAQKEDILQKALHLIKQKGNYLNDE